MRTLLLLLACLLPLRADAPLDAEYSAQAGTAITIIFDNSGSMAGDKITEAKQAFRWWLEKAPDNYTWSLIDFDNGGQIAIPFTADARQKVAAQVDQLRAHTNTPIVNSLKLAMKQIGERRTKVSPYQRFVVLLFTDGEENQDPGGDAEVLKTIQIMRAGNIEVVGIGYHGDGDYLAQAATRYFQADSAEALRSGLSQVDAEVDLGGEVLVTPDELKVMAGLAPAQAAGGNTATGQPENRPAHSISKWWIFLIVFVLALQVFKRKKPVVRKSNRR